MSTHYEVVIKPKGATIKCHSEAIAVRIADELIEDDSVETVEVNQVTVVPIYRRDKPEEQS